MLKATHEGLVTHWIKLTLTVRDGSPAPAPRSHLCTPWAALVHEDPLRPPKPRHHRIQWSVIPDTSSRTARGSQGRWAMPKAQLRYVMWQMRPILQNAADVVWGRLIPQRVSNEGWTRTNYMIHHITGLHSPHQGHHSYILKLKPEKSGMKYNYFHPVWLS